MKLRILIVEDDPMVAHIHTHYFNELKNFEIVKVIDNGRDAYEYLSESSDDIDLVILDVHMPKMSGLEMLKKLREDGNDISVIPITAINDNRTISEFLNLGVIDYLVKPFSIEELMARLRAMQRRAQGFSGSGQGNDAESTFLAVGGLTINTQTRDVHRSGQRIQLSVKEYELLCFLMRGSGKVLERSEIMKGVWGEDFYGDDNLLDVYIRYLRQKVESKDLPPLIHTVRGVGFILRDESHSSNS